MIVSFHKMVHLSQCTTRKGRGEESRILLLPTHILFIQCTESKATKLTLSNTDVLKASNDNKGEADDKMYSSAIPNDIPCFLSLLRPLHKELFFQIQTHLYLSGRVLPKQTLKKNLARCFNYLILAVN